MTGQSLGERVSQLEVQVRQLEAEVQRLRVRCHDLANDVMNVSASFHDAIDESVENRPTWATLHLVVGASIGLAAIAVGVTIWILNAMRQP